MKELPSDSPRWAKIAFVAVWVVSAATLLIISIFTGDITDFLADRVGMTAVIVGGLVGFAMILWIGWQLERSDRRGGPRQRR